MPSDDEVIEEILCLEKIQKARKKAAAEPPRAAEESDDEADVYDGDGDVYDGDDADDGDGEVHDDCEGEEEDSDESDDGERDVELPSDVVVDRDPQPLILTDDEISSLYEEITEPRVCSDGGCDADFEFEDFFDELIQKELGPRIPTGMLKKPTRSPGPQSPCFPLLFVVFDGYFSARYKKLYHTQNSRSNASAESTSIVLLTKAPYYIP